MAYPEVIELFDSGSGGLTTNDKGLFEREVVLRWLVSGKNGYLAAEEWAVENAPVQNQGHRRTRLDIRGLGNGWYEVAASYTNAAFVEPEETGDTGGGGDDGKANSISIDTTGGTEHITQANPAGTGTKQTAFAKVGLTAPDMKGALNFEGDQVRGIDVTVPQFNFTETWTFPSEWVVQNYIATLYSLTGKVNSKPFRIFVAEEVLFLGARFEMQQGGSAVAITYSFSARPNAEDLEVGDVTVDFKAGWDYMQVVYETVSADGSIIKRPKFVYVSSVYEKADFSLLSIGTEYPGVYLPGGSFDN